MNIEIEQVDEAEFFDYVDTVVFAAVEDEVFFEFVEDTNDRNT